jgi:small subunit ribosomal protein S17
MENKTLSIRGKSFTGKVVSAKMHRTVVVEWERRVLVPKFERYTKRKSKISAHNPDEINAKEGDIVRIQETRPISKTKNFVVVEILESI